MRRESLTEKGEKRQKGRLSKKAHKLAPHECLYIDITDDGRLVINDFTGCKVGEDLLDTLSKELSIKVEINSMCG